MTERFFRQITAKENLASNIDKAFLDQDWTFGLAGIDYAPLNVKTYMKDILLEKVSFENRNLKLLVACSIIIYKMLYETEQNQKMFAPANIQQYPSLNMIRTLKNTICETYNLAPSAFGDNVVSQSDIEFNNLSPENKKILISAMYNFIYTKIKEVLNLKFDKKDLTIEYKYYTTIYRYIVILLQSLLHNSKQN